MTLPSAVSKASVDQGAVDSPAAGRANIESAIDALNTIITHLGTSGITSGANVLGIGTGLTSSGGDINVNVGTGIGQIAQLIDKGGSAALGVMDGSNLTGVEAGLIQSVNTLTGAVATGTTITVLDDTIPQNTEGDEFMTLAITPTNTNSKLEIDVVFCGSNTVGNTIVVALFQDSTADALAACAEFISASGGLAVIKFTHHMTAGTTSATTFKVRAGAASDTTTFNGVNSARRFGGVMASSITIREIAA